MFLDGTKTELRTNICQTLDGKKAEGASAIRGKHIILCPDAFTVPVQETILLSEQTIGTSLDTLTSTDAVLLHEVTHCVLANGDTVYGVNGVILQAPRKAANSQKIADSWMYYAMASLFSKNAWLIGLAQPIDNFGPKAPSKPPSDSPNGKRDTVPLDIRGP